jgi:16S rRNA (guanine527-N7)-methyltransferase
MLLLIDKMDDIITNFQSSILKQGLLPTMQQLNQFDIYYKTLVEWNQHMNLTAITDRKDVYVKHFIDSLTLASNVNLAEIDSIADIGSGAGFPSIPLKIMFPHLRVTIVDSLKKRIGFLETLMQRLALNNVNCIHGRAEDIARTPEHRDAYQLVTARAVARLPILNELCLPFTRINGVFISMKGSDYANEIKESEKSLQILKGKVENIYVFQLPEENATRANIVIRKVGLTPKLYPRKAGIPIKQPIV